MIVHTRRLEYRPPWSEQPSVNHVPLEPLSVGETARIVEARFGAEKLPEELRRLITAKAEGNALFAEEFVSFLLERGFVSREAERPGFRHYNGRKRTTNKRAIAARRTRGSPRIRRPRPAASRRRDRPPFRSRFASSSCAASSDIDASLTAMQALDLIHREDKTAEYIFKHALVRDAVYSSLLNAARSTLHLKIAEEIERRSANRLPEVAETLAYHYTSTSRTDKAFLYLAMAAKKCLDIHSLDEADRYARQALDLLETKPGLRRQFGRRRRHGEPSQYSLREIRVLRNQARCRTLYAAARGHGRYGSACLRPVLSCPGIVRSQRIQRVRSLVKKSAGGGRTRW